MKTNHTDKQLQDAIDGACDKLAQNSRVYLNALDLDNTTEHWHREAPARLDLIKSALAALPEPEPPTVDGKTPGLIIYQHFNSSDCWGSAAEWYKKVCEKAASAVLAAFGKQSQPQLSQLRPLSEAGEVVTINDGGPAFPITENGLQGYNGMSLRDYFAGQALAGSDISTVMAEALKAGATSDEFSQILSMSVYKIADAMIKAREVKP